MRDFSIDIIWAKIQAAITAVGGWIGWFLGGVDGMLIALIVLMALDYLSGVMCAIVDKKLSSAIGFKGNGGFLAFRTGVQPGGCSRLFEHGVFRVFRGGHALDPFR